MRVIFLKDVPKIGKKYEIKNIADGHALNFLIPQGAVKVATADSIKKVEALKAVLDGERKVKEDILSKNLHEIDGKEVVIKVKANEKGHLFASLHASEIVVAIKESIGADILADFIVLEKPIKETGTHEILINVGGKKATIKLMVEGQ